MRLFVGYLLPNNPNNASNREKKCEGRSNFSQIKQSLFVTICGLFEDYLKLFVDYCRLFALFVDYLRIICKIICELFELFADYLHYLLADIV